MKTKCGLFILGVLLCLCFATVQADTETPSIQIENCEQIEVYATIDNAFRLSYSYTPETYTDEIKSWSSDNPKVVRVNSSSGLVTPIGVGTANITLETVNGLSDTIKIVVKSGPNVQEGQVVESNNLITKRPIIYHSFIPDSSGIYAIKIIDYDSQNKKYGARVYEDGKVGLIKGDTNLDLETVVYFELESGKAYHLGTIIEDSTGNSHHSFSIIKVTPSPSPTPVPTKVPETIVAGEKKEVAASEETGMKRYMFIPEDTGIYKFYSLGVGYDVYGQILNSSEKVCERSDNLYPYYGYNRYQGNFLIEHKFIAGEVYYLESCLSKSSYSVAIEKLPVATAIDILGDEKDIKYQMENQLGLKYTPEDGRDQIISWKSDNPEVVTVSGGKVFGKSFGSANITVTTESGLTDSIKVNVVDHTEIKANELKSHWSIGGPFYYKFVPEKDGIYRFVMVSEHNAYTITTTLYDDSFGRIDSWNSHDSGEAEIQLTAGTKYYICFQPHTDDYADSADLTIEMVSEVTPEPTATPTIVPTATPEPIETPTETPTIEPTVTPTIAPTATETPDIRPTESPTICTTPEPTVSATEIVEPDRLLGDVNGDKKVNAEDALAVLKHSAKIDILADEILEVADVDTSKLIDAKDALEILKIAAGITVAE